jgi:integrase
MTLNDFAQALWAQLDITPKTRSNYLGAYNRNIAPSLGHLPLDQVTKQQIAQALALLKPQTKYQALMVCRVIFREAVDQCLIEVSPAASIKSPKLNVVPGKFLTWDEIKGANFGRQTGRIKFLALHGLRWGEVVALTEADIFGGMVHVNKSMYGATKTKAGIRDVPHLSPYEPFPKTPKSVATALKPYGVTIHSLRKTYAYNLKKSGVHVTTAQKLMGHSSPMVTLSIYTGFRDDEIAETGEALRKTLGL